MTENAVGENGAGEREARVVQASADTRSWLQILTGRPGEVTVLRNGKEVRVSVDDSGTARLVAQP